MTGRKDSRSPSLAPVVALCLMAAGLGACGGNMDELNQYIDDVKARPGKRPEPLPEIKPYETFAYSADDRGLRSPFRSQLPTVDVNSTGGPRPDTDRSREYLEQFPLDSMQMVGTLEMGGRRYGLVQAADGLIHRVLPGNYMGQNDGRVIEVGDSEIVLKEIVSDGIGGYLERDAAVSLAD